MLHFPDRKRWAGRKYQKIICYNGTHLYHICKHNGTNLMVYAEEQTETQAADQTEVLEVESPSCILVEASTGQVLFEKTVMKPWLRLRLQRL